MASAEVLPHWDMSTIYSGLEGDDYRAAFATLDSELAELDRFLTDRSIGRLASPPERVGAGLSATLDELLRRVNSIERLYQTFEPFVYAFLSTNSLDPIAARETSKLELLDTRRQKLAVRWQAWIGSLGPRLDELIAGGGAAGEHDYFLRDTARQSRYLMTEELEALSAELAVDGAGAFSKLQGNVTSQLKVPFERNGSTEELPITVVHNLCSDPDPEVRRRAYDAEVAGWHSVRTTVAASLNAIKGAALTLAKRRGRSSVLETALDANKIDRETLDALLGAIREAFPIFRRYLASKAKKLGKPRLAWWDLFAPVGESRTTYTWSQARDFLADRFGSFSRELSEFSQQAFARRWIDAEPRAGKRGGGFCMALAGAEESRILVNFDGSFDLVSTLAHELGHAWHNETQRGLEPLKRGLPMALAETASIFCETLVTEAALRDADPAERLPILEAQLLGATQTCLDISSRYLFETRVLEHRGESELSPDEICELMLAAQRETYADAIDEATYHRYMWLWKPHYYSPSWHFYNFPYAFGLLFGLGLYAQYKEQGESFIPRYRELLRSTGQDDAAPLAARFGVDIRSPCFWRQSLGIVEDQVRRYEAL